MKEEGWRTQTLGQREEEYGDDADADADNKKCNSRMRLSHHPSSRIFRVSRASGGKDRHSKVYTSKGLRDRRIRLSASTAIQFYDLQDRLGYDQPSKAIEWLIKAAASAIAELPSLEYTFSEKPLPIEGGEGGEVEPSSTSETSKSSVLSLSRTAIRVKEKDEDHHNNNVEQVSFTKLLLTRGGGGTSSSNGDYLYSRTQLEMQQFALFQEHSCYSISPTLSGFHSGGTLQSNSPSHHHHHEGRDHQEPFFFSAVADSGAASPTENPSYSAGLQICKGYEQLELKGKGKS